jgi:hypothetical protein
MTTPTLVGLRLDRPLVDRLNVDEGCAGGIGVDFRKRATPVLP